MIWARARRAFFKPHVLLLLLHPSLIIFLFLFILFRLLLHHFKVISCERAYVSADKICQIHICMHMYILTICACMCVCWNVRSRKRSQGCHPPCTPSTYNSMSMCVCLHVCAAKKSCPLQLSAWTGSKNNAHSNGTTLITNSYAYVGLPCLLILSKFTELLKR